MGIRCAVVFAIPTNSTKKSPLLSLNLNPTLLHHFPPPSSFPPPASFCLLHSVVFKASYENSSFSYQTFQNPYQKLLKKLFHIGCVDFQNVHALYHTCSRSLSSSKAHSGNASTFPQNFLCFLCKINNPFK